MINLKNKLYNNNIIHRYYIVFWPLTYLLLTFFTISRDILFFNVTYVDKPLVLCSWYVNKCLPFEEFELLLTRSIVSISLNHSNLKKCAKFKLFNYGSNYLPSNFINELYYLGSKSKTFLLSDLFLVTMKISSCDVKKKSTAPCVMSTVILISTFIKRGWTTKND